MQNASLRSPSDLTDPEGQLLERLLPPPARRGHPRVRDLREILDGIFYLLRSSCAWRMLPKEFGPWSTVYDYYRRWRRQGVWENINHTLRQQVRRAAGQHAAPTGAILDSQPLKPGDQARARGCDAGKKVEGRKRHVVVDALGLLLLALVGPARVQDRDGARPWLTALLALCRGLQKIWADGGYAGTWVAGFKEQVGECSCGLEIVRRLGDQTGCYVLPKRWIVERTLSWLVQSRRRARDYETLPHSSQAMIDPAMIRLRLKRLTKAKAGFPIHALTLKR